MFQHTAARRRLGVRTVQARHDGVGFNTQPPEGGWQPKLVMMGQKTKFQHTAARRRLVVNYYHDNGGFYVSTHSRPKAAGYSRLYLDLQSNVSTHSRPKAAGGEPEEPVEPTDVSTHSRPKAAGNYLKINQSL